MEAFERLDPGILFHVGSGWRFYCSRSPPVAFLPAVGLRRPRYHGQRFRILCRRVIEVSSSRGSGILPLEWNLPFWILIPALLPVDCRLLLSWSQAKGLPISRKLKRKHHLRSGRRFEDSKRKNQSGSAFLPWGPFRIPFHG
jgi:hypothetical protein